ncbi:hypothetical protein LRP88_11194 [Fusarium phalaenopsidis]
MKICVVFSIFGLLLTPAAAVPVTTSTGNGVESVADTLDDFFPLFTETTDIIENIDFDNAQPAARDKLNEMLDLCVLLVERFYKTKGSDNIKKLNQDEQKEVCDKFDQFTSEFDDFTTSLHMVAMGIDANTRGITKPLRTLVPICKDKAEGNAQKILEDLKILIRGT